MIDVGSSAPGFELTNQDGDPVSLADYAGRRVLLAFYPADFSSVCRDQFSLYEERLAPQLADGEIVLLGISVDGVFSHKAFHDKLQLSIPLLSDFHPKGEVSDAYGAYISERGHSNRSLVLIDGAGIVEWTYVPDTPLDIPPPDTVLSALG